MDDDDDVFFDLHAVQRARCGRVKALDSHASGAETLKCDLLLRPRSRRVAVLVVIDEQCANSFATGENGVSSHVSCSLSQLDKLSTLFFADELVDDVGSVVRRLDLRLQASMI